MPKILSVIIPMYNAKQYVTKCLDSLLLAESVMKKLDILVVNDGSTDGCEAAAAEYASRYAGCIRLLNKVNGGHGSAVNYAVPYCRGMYVRVLDADDWFLSENLAAFIKELESAGRADLVLSPYRTFDIRTKHGQLISAGGRQGMVKMKELTRQWKYYKQLCCLHGLTYRTDFYKKRSKKLPEGVSYDDAFYSAIPAYQAERILVLALPVYVYRIGDEHQSVSLQNRVRRSAQLAAVIWAMQGAFDNRAAIDNQSYFYYKAVSSAADYFITVCLRHPQRTKGRKMARETALKWKKHSPVFFRHIRRKYAFLYAVSVLGISEKCFYKCMMALSSRQRKGW